MKTNKLMRCITGILTLLPLIVMGVGFLVSVLSTKTYTFDSGDTRFNTGAYFIDFIDFTFSQLFNFNMDVSSENILDYLGHNVFTQNNLFGYINFVGLFDNLFISLNYNVDFSSIWLLINWYLNYILMIQLIMFIPRVLMWFINWSFNMIDTLSYKGGLRK